MNSFQNPSGAENLAVLGENKSFKEIERSNVKFSPKLSFSSKCFVSLLFLGTLWVGAICINFSIRSNKKIAMNMASTYSGYKLKACESVVSYRTVCCSQPNLPVLGGIDLVNLYYARPGTLPIIGSDEFTAILPTSMAEYLFYFHTADNRDEFEADPWKFAPAYGGFDSCSVGLEERSKREENLQDLGPTVDLSKWELIDGKLYFFGNSHAKDQFLVDNSGVETANENWGLYMDGNLNDGVFNTNCFDGQTYFSLVMGMNSPEACRGTKRRLGAGFSEHTSELMEFDRRSDNEAGGQGQAGEFDRRGSAGGGQRSAQMGAGASAQQQASAGQSTGAGTTATAARGGGAGICSC